MKSKVLLFLKTETRKASSAVQATMKGEEFTPVKTAEQALALLKEPAEKARLFVVSREGDWVVVAAHHDTLNLSLGSVIAGDAESDGWLIERIDSRKMTLWAITEGQRSDQPQLMTNDKAESYLKTAGVDERLLKFVVAEHLEKDETKLGRHEDVILGFTVAEKSKKKVSEVTRALSDTKEQKEKTLDLDAFLKKAIKLERVRAIAKAQISEQLQRDGFTKQLEIINPQPEGHFCQTFKAESYSFTTNGPYVWFDWKCEEACEPRLPEEIAFPACDLRFELEKTAEI
jgi:hypothetical protein